MDVGAVLDLDIFKHGLCQPPKLALDIVLGNLRQRAAKMTLFKVVGDAAELGDLVHISVLEAKLVICIRSDRMRQRRGKKKMRTWAHEAVRAVPVALWDGNDGGLEALHVVAAVAVVAEQHLFGLFAAAAQLADLRHRA